MDIVFLDERLLGDFLITGLEVEKSYTEKHIEKLYNELREEKSENKIQFLKDLIQEREQHLRSVVCEILNRKGKENSTQPKTHLPEATNPVPQTPDSKPRSQLSVIELENILNNADLMLKRLPKTSASFQVGVQQTICSLRDFLKARGYLTERQVNAVKNIIAGASKALNFKSNSTREYLPRYSGDWDEQVEGAPGDPSYYGCQD